MALDLEKMLCSIEGDNPAGINEEYSPKFLELDSLIAGTSESQMGDSVIEGKGPDWKKLKANCLELWKTTRDFRVAVYLTVSEFVTNGLEGLFQGLSLIEYLVTELWDKAYPELDPDDDNDPIERLNAMALLAPPPSAYNDPVMFINRFRMVKLVPKLDYTLRDYMISNNDLETTSDKDLSLLTAEMKGVPSDVMNAQKTQVENIIAKIDSIIAGIKEKTDDEVTTFAPLQKELKYLLKFYTNNSVASEDVSESTSEASATSDDDTVSETKTTPSKVVQKQNFDFSTFVPGTRAEAVLLLKKSAEYFKINEPNSPVPFLVDRAIRMSSMSFMDLINDVEPNALEKVREILGVKQSSDSSDYD